MGKPFKKSFPLAPETVAEIETFFKNPPPLKAGTTSFQLPSVSEATNYSTFCQVSLSGGTSRTLQLDSGNSVMIYPNFDDIKDNKAYTVLGKSTEPWGCPVNVVRGPVTLMGKITIPNCIFYACTGTNQSGLRTANFGLSLITPWSSNGWNVPFGPSKGPILQSPLSYQTEYPYVELSLNTDSSSILNLYSTFPAGYTTTFPIISQLEWSSTNIASFEVNGKRFDWGDTPAVAFIDSGGGPFLASKLPSTQTINKTSKQSCPSWESQTTCICSHENITVTLLNPGSLKTTYTYTIDASKLPSNSCTAVICPSNEYLEKQTGCNIGGISFIFNWIVFDYKNFTVSLKPKAPVL